MIIIFYKSKDVKLIKLNNGESATLDNEYFEIYDSNDERTFCFSLNAIEKIIADKQIIFDTEYTINKYR